MVDKFNLHRIRDPVAFKRRPRVGNPAAPQVNGQKGKGTLSAKVKVGGGRQSKEPQKVGVSGLAVVSPELSKVVIFTEVGSGHFNNDVFHAFQVAFLAMKPVALLCFTSHKFTSLHINFASLRFASLQFISIYFT